MVISQNRGTQIQTQIYYSPYYGDPKKGTPNFGKPPYRDTMDGHRRITWAYKYSGSSPRMAWVQDFSAVRLFLSDFFAKASMPQIAVPMFQGVFKFTARNPYRNGHTCGYLRRARGVHFHLYGWLSKLWSLFGSLL